MGSKRDNRYWPISFEMGNRFGLNDDLDLDNKNRDTRDINVEIDLHFNDVIAEPRPAHGFDIAWKISFTLFSLAKHVTYCILAAILAAPFSVLWGLVFSLLTVLYVWIIRPVMRIFETLLAIFRRFWVVFLNATLAPLCDALGGLFRADPRLLK